jgi:hypothetical protein
MSLLRSTFRLTAAAAALTATAALAACGGNDEKAPSTAAAQPAAASSGLYGTYHRRVTRADVARTASHRSEASPGQVSPPAGIYRLTIARGSAQDVLKATDPQDFVIAMDVTLDRGGLLRATSYVDPEQGAFCGPEIPIPARYTYASRGGELLLTAKDDPCADRDSVLTGTWTRG